MSNYITKGLKTAFYIAMMGAALYSAPKKAYSEVLSWGEPQPSDMERIEEIQIGKKTDDTTWGFVNVPMPSNCSDGRCSYDLGELAANETHYFTARYLPTDSAAANGVEPSRFSEVISYTPGTNTNESEDDDSGSAEDESNTNDTTENMPPILEYDWDNKGDKIYIKGTIQDNEQPPRLYINTKLVATGNGSFEYYVPKASQETSVYLRLTDGEYDTTSVIHIDENSPDSGNGSGGSSGGGCFIRTVSLDKIISFDKASLEEKVETEELEKIRKLVDANYRP